MVKRRVGIIGGGFTGMAAASELRDAGVEVVLFEKNDFLGGLAAGFQEKGWKSSLEFYYHHWFKSDSVLQFFAKKWGAEAQLVFSHPQTVTETKSGKFVRLDSPFTLLRYPDLGFFDKIRMGLALAFLRLTNSWKELERETAHDWCRRVMGETGFRELWQPLLVGKFGDKWWNRVNMAWFWSRLKTRTPALGTFQGGFQRFIEKGEDALAKQGVLVVKGVGKLEVRPSVGGEEGVHWTISGAPASVPTEFNDVIICAAPGVLAATVPVARSWADDFFKDRLALGAQVIILSLDRRLGAPGVYWYSLRKSKEAPFLAAIEHTEFVPAEEYAGEHLIYLADYVDLASPDWKRSDADLEALGKEVLRKINPGFQDSWLKRRWVFREPYAQPVVGVNASLTLPPLKVPVHQGLYHASMGHVYPFDRGTNFALELGQRVARECLAGRS